MTTSGMIHSIRREGVTMLVRILLIVLLAFTCLAFVGPEAPASADEAKDVFAVK